jgi:outer membrane protein assembly factor BamB
MPLQQVGLPRVSAWKKLRQFHGDPLITDRLLVIGTDGRIGHVYAFERTTGAVLWKYKVNDRGVASDVIRAGDDGCFVTLGFQNITVLDVAHAAIDVNKARLGERDGNLVDFYTPPKGQQ